MSEGESDHARQPPLDRKTILDRATKAQQLFNEGYRRFTVKGLCRDRYRAGPYYDGPGTDLSDDDIIEAAYGLGGAAVYWRAWLYGADSRTDLAQALAAHCAADQDGYHRIWTFIVASLKKAPADQDLFADAEWLLNNPNTRCFVPSSLAAYFAPQPQTPGPPPPGNTPARRRGVRPVKFTATVTAMRAALDAGKMTLEILNTATEESLAAEFCIGRETARKARATVLKDPVANPNPDN